MCKLFMRQNNEFKEIYNCHLEDTLSTSVVVRIEQIHHEVGVTFPLVSVLAVGRRSNIS